MAIPIRLELPGQNAARHAGRPLGELLLGISSVLQRLRTSIGPPAFDPRVGSA